MNAHPYPSVRRSCANAVRPVWFLLAFLAGGAFARADNGIQWDSLSVPSTALGGTLVDISATVTNTGSERWGGSHYLAVRNSTGTVIALESINDVEAGYTVTKGFSFAVPNVAAALSFTIEALEHEVEYFGAAHTRKVNVTYNPPYAGMQLSTTTFDSLAPARISTTDSVVNSIPYRLRAKVINDTAWGWHAANLWNVNGQPLDNTPPPGHYAICALYWVRYQTLYGTVLEVGPERRVAIEVSGSVSLSSNWFHASSPPIISSNEHFFGSTYRLFATFTDGRGGTWETSSGLNNNDTLLTGLPPAGTYQVTLLWRKYGPGMIETTSSTPRVVQVEVVAGPLTPLDSGGYIRGEWGCTGEGEDESCGTSYSEDSHNVVVAVPGILRVRATAQYAGDVYLNAFAPSGEPMQSGIPEMEFPVSPGTYTVRVTAGRELSYGVTGELYPYAPAPVITSPTEAAAAIGVEFASYSVTVAGSGLVTFSAPNPGELNGLPPGLSINTVTGAITGTPTTVGTYNVWVTASNSAGSAGKWVTFTILSPPGKPTNLVPVTNGSTSIVLYWNAPIGNPPAVTYQVEANNILMGTTSERLFTLTNLTPATIYNLKVRAASAAGIWSKWSADALAITSPTTTPGQNSSVWIEVPQVRKDQNGNIIDSRYLDGIQDEILPMGPTGFLSLRWVDFDPSYSITVAGYDDPYTINDYWDLINTYGGGDIRPISTPTFNWPTLWITLSGLSATLEVNYARKEDQEYQVYHDEGYAIHFSPLNLDLVGEELYSPDDGTWRDTFPGYELLSGARHAFYLVRRGKKMDKTILTLPDVGETFIAIRTAGNTPTAGPVTLGGVTIDVGGTSGSIAFPGGATISVNNGVVSVSGFPGVPDGPITATVPLGGLGTVEVDTAGNATITVGNGIPVLTGAVITANAAGGGNITLSNGAGISISSSGQVDVTLPKGTDPTIVQVLDIANKVLSIGAGAVISVKDIFGKIVPFPSSGILGDLDAAILAKGVFSVGIKLGNDSTFWFNVYTGRPQIAVDANRDGQISFTATDATTTAAPYRFWLNDDDDGNALNNETEVEGSSSPDYASRGDFGIASKRDLEDFARLWINSSGITDALKSGDLQIGLQWKADTVTGSPAINLYRHYEANGGTGYLTDNAVAIQQTTPPYSTTLVDAGNKNVLSSTNGVFILKKELFANLSSSQTKTHLLFEGAGVGKGMLQLLLLNQSGAQIGEGSGVWLDIRRINTMFERVKATTQYALSSDGIDATMPLPHDYINPAQVPQPTMGWTPDDRGESFVPDPSEDLQNKNYIVFVHGWRQAPGIPPAGVTSSLTYARTMFKRLWHAGYKGRFAAFRWPTFYSGPELDDQNFLDGILTYNDSEYRAWKAGQSLAQYVNQLPSDYKRRIAAHSMGNVVAGSAFKNGMAVDTYALLNAAVPAICFDARVQRRWPTFTGIYSPVTLHRDYNVPSSTPNAPNSGTPVDDASAVVRDLSYLNQLSGLSGDVINFYLETDFATSISWNANNLVSRPDAFALPLDGSSGYKYISTLSDPNWRLRLKNFSGSERSVTDAHEVMSYDCKVPTFTSGADGSTGGSIAKPIDMGTYGFDREHSAQWQWRFQQTARFYYDLLVEFGLTPTL